MNDTAQMSDPQKPPRVARIISLFVRHANAANLVMALMLMAGVFALLKLNTQFFPTAEIKIITVSIKWPGASAEDVEQGILEVVEPQLRYLDDVKKVESYAREGAGSIQLEYERDADMQQALDEAKTALQDIPNLPEASETPEANQIRFRDRVAKVTLSGPFSETALRVYAQRMRNELLQAGIDQVTFSGMRDLEIKVEIPASQLRRLELTPAVMATLR